MSSRTSARSSAKISAENRMVRRREREHEHQTKWNNQVRYYKSWEKTNNKFEEWTSPRYYENNNQMIETIKRERERKEKLEKRREKLKKMIDEENRAYQIELMVKNRCQYIPKLKEERPVNVLKDVYLGIKHDEDERKRHEAELALYHQWRNNNPILRDYERRRSVKDIKLSWLDQQIEKRLEKEKAEEECRRLLLERDRQLEEEKLAEEQLKREILEKNEKLREDLEKQIRELQLKQEKSDELKHQEEQEIKKFSELAEIEESHKANEKRKAERELALENLKQHKMKLKQKALDVRENLRYEQEMIKKLTECEIVERMEDTMKKNAIKKTMIEFQKFAREQQDLEMQRQKHFDFVFDSESRLVYERQQHIWAEEQKARENLLKDVLDTIKEQINEKIQRNKEQQRETLKERQQALKLVEEYNNDIQKRKEEEQHKKEQWEKEIKAQIKEKQIREKREKLQQQEQFELELEMARKEEERLRKEIVELQRRQGPIRHARSRILF